MQKSTLTALRAGAAPLALAMALAGAPALAQDTPAPATTVAADDVEEEGDVILVTGTLFSRTDTETASPVSTLSSETLQERGINTVAEAIQRIPSNNAGTIQQGWNTGFNFASGANAPALRGLTVQSTLSIADGLRLAPYPLADDGQRNFVDLNTIPSAVVDRIEVLRDGASSTYGADAIAGVINVITKKEIQGLHLNGSFGISQEGDAGEQRIDATYGYGDLNEQGFNFYVSGEYQRQDALWARDRGFPFNTADWSSITNPDTGSGFHNLNWNAITPEDGQFNAFFTIPGVTMIRPYAADGTTTAGGYSFLNPEAGCRGYEFIDGETILNEGGSAAFPNGVCTLNQIEQFIMLQPEIERHGVTARLTFNAGADAQVYAMANYYNTETRAEFTPLGFNGTPTPPTSGATAYNVWLPDYVCDEGVGTPDGMNTGCDATNGVLNPYNPYAGTGTRARAFLRSPFGRTDEANSRSLRGVLGIDGGFGDNWRYSANFTASEVKLTRTQANYLIPQRIMDVVATGEFNFADPMANSQDVWDYIAPTSSVVSTSQLWQAQATLAKDLFELPGGPLQAAVGLSYREESIDAPSANPQNDAHPYDRYYSINSVGTEGSRNVKSGFFEINAPVVDILELGFSGRYDKYSTGQENFSPKVTAKLTPIPEVVLRGTFSKGFRIPSFNEAFGLPTTGYISREVDCTSATFADFCAAHGNNAYATNSFPVGLTQTGNPELDPEKSTSFTAGIIVEPIRNVSLTVDFWHIKVKGIITAASPEEDPFEAYYANNGVVNIPGVIVIPGNPDPNNPAALPHIGFIQTSFENADSQVVSGIDFGANVSLPVTDTINWRSSAEASYLAKYDYTDKHGVLYEYAGTLSPCNITSCSGAPSWRATWQNTLEFGENTSITATAYYTKGYSYISNDSAFGGPYENCEAAIGASVPTTVDGEIFSCRSEDVWNVDLTASHTINDTITVFANILNVFDIDAPFDPAAAYGLFGFNPAWSGPNILGRYFRLGARVDF